MTAAVTLDASYARCKELNKAFGTTYYAATLLLPRAKRPHVHALYGFCRYADDIVDDLGPAPLDVREKALADFGDRFIDDLAAGRSDDPVGKAVVHTARMFDLDADLFRRFLRSMTMDLSVTEYETFDDLLDYMDGSAAVIGEMMLPILDPTDRAAATPGARALGIAFQLTNFIRDVGEDLARGRIYLPQEDCHRFGVDPRNRRVDHAWKEFLRFQIERTNAFYCDADSAVAYLPLVSKRCIRVARQLYSEILERVAANDYDVFTCRARVPGWRKAAVVARAYVATPSRH